MTAPGHREVRGRLAYGPSGRRLCKQQEGVRPAPGARRGVARGHRNLDDRCRV